MSVPQLALPEPAPSQDPIDKQALEATLSAFTLLMQRALVTNARNRFAVVGSLAMQAGKLLHMVNPRVADFDGAPGFDDIELLNGGGMMGGQVLGARQARIAMGGGDQMELFRTLITELGGMANQVKPLAPTTELRDLLEIKSLMKTLEDDTTEIDARIAVLKGLVTNAVVPAELLRGHQTQAPGGPVDGAVLAQVDGQRDQGAHRAV